MERLKKLEKVQKIMELMQSHGIIEPSNQNPQSYLFLANFTLFLIQPSDELNIHAKCLLISDHVTKMSASFLEEALESVSEEGNQNMRNDIPPDDMGDLDPSPNAFEETALVGLDAMLRANSTLEDFFRSYLMFHEMDVRDPQSIFRYLPILSFTESYIYQLDSLNEKLLQLPAYGLPVWDTQSVRMSKAGQTWEAKSLTMLNKDPCRPLVLLLEQHGLLTERIIDELKSGVEYWALERKLCSSLSKDEITIGDVMRAVHLKSFDYRVLNLLLYELREEKLF